jgi:hypothetical protein
MLSGLLRIFELKAHETVQPAGQLGAALGNGKRPQAPLEPPALREFPPRPGSPQCILTFLLWLGVLIDFLSQLSRPLNSPTWMCVYGKGDAPRGLRQYMKTALEALGFE